MTLKFRYKLVKRPDGTEVKAPVVPLRLSGEKGSFDTPALLDSGADISVMPEVVAETLGLDLSGERSPAFGIGGKSESVGTFAEITIGKKHEIYNFKKTPFKVILGEYEFPILLGRVGFFDKFIITFDQKKETISLKRIDKWRGFR